MKRALIGLLLLLVLCSLAWAEDAPISGATQSCLDCHAVATPGLVSDWKAGRHSRISPAQALKLPPEARRFSADQAPEGLAEYAVGCAECHQTNNDSHQDTFDHDGEDVHVVVTPADCAVCHPRENQEYQLNKMSQAHHILKNNPLYGELITSINGTYHFKDRNFDVEPPDRIVNGDSCYHCHGTAVEVQGTITVDSELGEMDFPHLVGWPNQGVGRLNPDGSTGSCTPCHARHQFSISLARQPYTCSQCHKGPDVPAYKVYEVSKHGNMFSTLRYDWNFDAVPWTVGKDFTAPTCAVCHVSLVVDADGNVKSKRTHQMNDRLPWRLLGLIYAHRQPKEADTSIIKTKSGLPLPTELTGEPASEYLIDDQTFAERTKTMQGVCLSCHGTDWVKGHWAFLDRSIEVTNETTLAATKVIMRAWEEGLCQGPAEGGHLFDEALERKWTETWLFYANSIRLTSAMGGADYGVFDRGRWQMTNNLMEMTDWLGFLRAAGPKK